LASRDAERSYRAIFESLGEGLILNDLESGRVVEANAAAAAMHGYGREGFLGLHPTDYMLPTAQAQFAGWVRVLQSGELAEATVSHVRRDGTPLDVDVRGTLCLWARQPCLLSAVRDVSARTRHEAQLREEMEARLAEQALILKDVQVAAALAERKRLAQNLHDAVNQSLFSAGLIAEVLPRLWERHPEQVREALEDLRRLTRGALAEMRGLLVDLRPAELADSKLEDLLRLLADALTGRTNIPVELSVTEEAPGRDVELPTSVHMAFYRLCQEALSNVSKHSAATQATIELHYKVDRVVLSIRDNGCGFDPDAVPSAHFGLSMMRERAAAIGATLDIVGRPGEGAEIVATWRRPEEQPAG